MMRIATILRGKAFQGLMGKNDFPCFNASISRAGFSTAGANDKIHASYCIYKGKAALSVSPVPPTLSRLSSGSLKVDRQGVMMLTFTPSIGERKYDWEKKQFFALSATEAGCVISLGLKESCEFFHDPSMKSSSAGQVRKTMSIKPSPGGNGFFFTLNVVNNITQTNERFTVPVTPAEFAVIRTAFTYALPHIMAWDMFTNQQQPKGPKGLAEGVSKEYKYGEARANAAKDLDLEWEK